MDLSRTPRWSYLLIACMGLLVLGLGVWWMYLLSVFARSLGPGQHTVLNMLKWEGTTFFLLIAAFGGTLLMLHRRDLKRSRALQALFASLTHELKTPLASMRLQAEVIRDLIADESHDHAQLTALTTRLIQDTAKFEHELDKGLQLSRVEGQGTLTLAPVDLARLVKKLASKSMPERPVEVQGEAVVLADEMALAMVLRNLFENTQRYSAGGKVSVRFEREGDHLVCTYDDHGRDFSGDRSRLGELFYKHDSRKGTGIGLYLVRELMRAQHGRLEFSEQGPLIFRLVFRRAEEMA